MWLGKAAQLMFQRVHAFPKEFVVVTELSFRLRGFTSAVYKVPNNGRQPSRPVPRLPRYLRRQGLVKKTQSEPATQQHNNKKASPKARILESLNVSATAEPKQLLEPYTLSQRLKRLAAAGQLDDAVFMLKNAPLDAQNVPVWNTLISECMKAKRYKVAYQLFTDMKRRGFSPTTRTYQTIFTGLSRIEFWSANSKQLANAHSLYAYFQRHIRSLKEHEPESKQLSNMPLAHYIKILGDAGEYQTMFDVYYSLDSSGPMAPNQYIYTAMFHALTGRKEASVQLSLNQPPFDPKLLWSQMLKASQNTPGFPIDSHLVTAAMSALSRGNVPDQCLAFKIAREYFGLGKPGDAASTGSIPLTTPALAAALLLCNVSRNHLLCVHFFRLARDRQTKQGGEPIIDRAHVEEILKAHIALAAAGSQVDAYDALQILDWQVKQEVIDGRHGPKIRPTISTFTYVLMACWRGGDWNSAMRTFNLMTGYHSDDFEDGKDVKMPQLDKRSTGRNILPNAEAMSCILRTAIASQERPYMRQALRIVDHLGLDNLLQLFGGLNPSSIKGVKRSIFYQNKLAEAVVEAVEIVRRRKGKESLDVSEVERWRVLSARAKERLKVKREESLEEDFILYERPVQL